MDLMIVMLKIDPWKRIDRDSEFDLPESVFLFEESVAQPLNIINEPRQFAPDKIRDI